MKFKIADIKKIGIFSPGTAGERAIRIETEDGVEIFDQEECAELEIKENSRPRSSLFLEDSGDKILGKVEFLIDPSLDWRDYIEEYDFEAASFEEAWKMGIDFLTEINLPRPKNKDLSILDDEGWRIAYWESDNWKI